MLLLGEEQKAVCGTSSRPLSVCASTLVAMLEDTANSSFVSTSSSSSTEPVAELLSARELATVAVGLRETMVDGTEERDGEQPGRQQRRLDPADALHLALFHFYFHKQSLEVTWRLHPVRDPAVATVAATLAAPVGAAGRKVIVV